MRIRTQWVADWYDKDYYKRSPERNPTGPESGRHRVLRGGNYQSDPIDLRTASRAWADPSGYGFYGFAFRCARGAQ